VTSAADETISSRELQLISDIVSRLPVFDGFDMERLDALVAECCTYLENANGIEHILNITQAALSEKLQDTAYALAVEVAACGLDVKQEELVFLQLLADRWELENLTVAAIERSARIRYRKG